MTATNPLANQIAPMADPAARQARRNEGKWRIWLGWAAAATLHGGVLAALIFSWPARLNPAPPDPAAISLLIDTAEKPASQPPVRSSPHDAPTIIPATVPVKTANTPPAQNPKPFSSLPRMSSRLTQSKPSPAPRGVVKTKTVAQQDGGGFIAAQPVSGSANQPPEYPQAAYVHGEQGDVLLSIHVLANGETDSVSVTQSSGYRILDEAAAKAVWKWRFQPSTLSGQQVPSVIPYRINFNLQNEPSAN